MATNAQLIKYAEKSAEEEFDLEKTHLLTEDSFKKALPAKMHHLVKKEVLDNINDIIENTPLRESFRDNLLSYSRVLQEGRVKLTDYINAVKYVSYKLLGDTNLEAYTKTFPQRYNRFLSNGVSSKDIAAHVAAYHKRKLVTSLLEQSVVPSWLLNQDLYQKALNVSADLMLNANSEKVRADAANNLLTHLKQPEVAKVELDVKTNEGSDVIAELRKTTQELAAQQRRMIESGANKAAEIAESRLVVDAEWQEIDKLEGNEDES